MYGWYSPTAKAKAWEDPGHIPEEVLQEIREAVADDSETPSGNEEIDQLYKKVKQMAARQFITTPIEEGILSFDEGNFSTLYIMAQQINWEELDVPEKPVTTKRKDAYVVKAVSELAGIPVQEVLAEKERIDRVLEVWWDERHSQ